MIRCPYRFIPRFRMEVLRHVSSKSPTSVSLKGAQRLHQKLEEGLVQNKSELLPSSGIDHLNPTTTINQITSKPRRNHNQTIRQAWINGVCSFMVVLLAVQSWKSGAEKRKAIVQRDEAEMLLVGVRQMLQQIQNEMPRKVAVQCAQVVLEMRQEPKTTTTTTTTTKATQLKDSIVSWFQRSTMDGNEIDQQIVLQNKIESVVRQHLNEIFEANEKVTMSPEEQDQKKAQALLGKQSLSTVSDDEALRQIIADADLNELIVANDVYDEGTEERVVVKKRIFSI